MRFKLSLFLGFIFSQVITILFAAPLSFATSPDYNFLNTLQFPWACGETRTLTQDWDGHWAIGFALDFGHPGGTAAHQDQPLLAPISGTITKGQGGSPGYGYWVKIHHANGWVVMLSHLGKPSQAPVQVETGQEVGKVGGSGSLTPHIHVEVRWQDSKVPDINQITNIFGQNKENFRWTGPGKQFTSQNCDGPPAYPKPVLQQGGSGTIIMILNDRVSRENGLVEVERENQGSFDLTIQNTGTLKATDVRAVIKKELFNYDELYFNLDPPPDYNLLGNPTWKLGDLDPGQESMRIKVSWQALSNKPVKSKASYELRATSSEYGYLLGNFLIHSWSIESEKPTLGPGERFVDEAEPTPYPVILIHGRCGQEWQVDEQLQDLLNYLREDGFDATYAMGISCNQSIWENAKQLEQSINFIKKSRGVDKVNLIGHSMGGIIARAFAESILNQLKNSINQIFMLGTPNTGTDLVKLLRAAKTYAYVRWGVDQFNAADYELTPEAMSAFNNYYTNFQNVPYHLIGGTGGQDRLAELVPDDFLIDVDSVHSGVTGSQLYKIITPDVHGKKNIFPFGTLPSYVFPRQTYESHIKPFLGHTVSPQTLNIQQTTNLSRFNNLPNLLLSAIKKILSPSLLAQTNLVASSVESVPLPPGSNATISFNIEPTTFAEVEIFWQGDEDLDANFTNPDGVVVDFNNQTTNTQLIKIAGVGPINYYRLLLTSPKAGAWQANLSTPAQNSQDILATLTSKINTPLIAALNLQGQSLTEGSSQKISFSLQNANSADFSDLSVKALIASGEILEEIELFDDGTHGDELANNLIFTNTWQSVEAEPANFQVSAQATGAYQGLPFERLAVSEFNLLPNHQFFQEVVNEECQDKDANALCDQLVLTLRINAPSSLSVNLSVSLTDAQNHTLNLNMPSQLQTGDNLIDLIFPAQSTKNSQLAGPLNLSLLLEKDGLPKTLIQEANNFYQTSSYNSATFQTQTFILDQTPEIFTTRAPTFSGTAASSQPVTQVSYFDDGTFDEELEAESWQEISLQSPPTLSSPFEFFLPPLWNDAYTLTLRQRTQDAEGFEQDEFFSRNFEVQAIPQVNSVTPNQIPLGQSQTIDIWGEEFLPEAQIFIGDANCPQTQIFEKNTNHLQCEVPGILLPGVYDLTIQFPDNSQAGLKNAIAVNGYKVLIEDDAPFTNQARATVNLYYPLGTKRVRVLNREFDPNARLPRFNKAKNSLTLPLSGPNGEKFVFAQFIDKDGEKTEIFSDSIILDRQKPTLQTKIEPQNPNNPKVTLKIQAQDNLSGIDKMRISESPLFPDAPWQDFAGETEWEFAPNQSVHPEPRIIFVQVRDKAQNESAPATNTIILNPN